MTPTSPLSSSVSAPALVVELKPSSLLRAWWYGLHALLAVAAALTALAGAVKALTLLALLCHAVVRRPRAAPNVIEFAADGSCAVPEWQAPARRLGPATLICPYWIRLHLNLGARQRYILLFADQISPHEWRRLRALLLRARSEAETRRTF